MDAIPLMKCIHFTSNTSVSFSMSNWPFLGQNVWKAKQLIQAQLAWMSLNKLVLLIQWMQMDKALIALYPFASKHGMLAINLQMGLKWVLAWDSFVHILSSQILSQMWTLKNLEGQISTHLSHIWLTFALILRQKPNPPRGGGFGVAPNRVSIFFWGRHF